MALLPQFSVSALNPSASGYSGADIPYLFGVLATSGGITSYVNPYGLADQHSNDELIIGYDPVDPMDENDLTIDIYRRCFYHLLLTAFSVRVDHQFLLVFGLTNPDTSFPATAQFFVGNEWIRSEPVNDPTDTMALLVDSPGDGNWGLDIFVRLASTHPFARIGLTGVQGFLL